MKGLLMMETMGLESDDASRRGGVRIRIGGGVGGLMRTLGT